MGGKPIRESIRDDPPGGGERAGDVRRQETFRISFRKVNETTNIHIIGGNAMNTNMNRSYKEVTLDGQGFEKNYRNPLSKVFRYEYALYTLLCGWFGSTVCRSMCVESLSLYFKELGRRPKTVAERDALSDKEKKRVTQEDILDEVTARLEQDVKGHITFPMMHECRAEVSIVPTGDGTHKLIFTDGIYGFSVRPVFSSRGKFKKLEVKDIRPIRVKDGGKDDKETALNCAA